jgi:hypothetical protein
VPTLEKQADFAMMTAPRKHFLGFRLMTETLKN